MPPRRRSIRVSCRVGDEGIHMLPGHGPLGCSVAQLAQQLIYLFHELIALSLFRMSVIHLSGEIDHDGAYNQQSFYKRKHPAED